MSLTRCLLHKSQIQKMVHCSRCSFCHNQHSHQFSKSLWGCLPQSRDRRQRPMPGIGRPRSFENMSDNIPGILRGKGFQCLGVFKQCYIIYRLGQSIWIERSNNEHIVLGPIWKLTILCTSKTAIQRQQRKQYKVHDVGRHPPLVMALCVGLITCQY